MLAVSGVIAGAGAWPGLHSVLAPAGAAAARIETLWWGLFWTSATVWALVVAAMLWAVVHPPAGRRGVDETDVDPRVQRRLTAAVAGAVALTAAVVLALTVTSFFTGRALAQRGDAPAIGIRVVGHQWWWEVRYEDPDPSRVVVTANEIHVPVGVPVLVKGTSRDVIHSFWAPSLAGKRDLIPGRQTELSIVAEREGTYRGQCAEFCGAQHAHMALVVVAQPPEEFEAWLEAQRRPAPSPRDASAARGRDVFLSSCHVCHTVRGTSAASNVGPDLTHVASRRTIAAGTLTNGRGPLAAWILDPQALKPGVRMPPTRLAVDELRALLDYLETLT